MKLSQWFSTLHKKRVAVALFFLLVSIVLYSLSGDYVSEHIGVVVPDIIVDHFGPYNLGIVYIWLFIIIIGLFFIFPLVYHPKELPYVMNMFSLFLAVRSGFVLFTRLQTPPDAIIVHFPKYLQLLNFSNDLFFSGHVGVPFLGFLVFKDYPKLRYFMLACSIILGIAVLLMHVHYSIDVLSAFFISYGIYHIGNKFIQK